MTFDVEAADVEGWTGKGPAPVRGTGKKKSSRQEGIAPPYFTSDYVGVGSCRPRFFVGQTLVCARLQPRSSSTLFRSGQRTARVIERAGKLRCSSARSLINCAWRCQVGRALACTRLQPRSSSTLFRSGQRTARVIERAGKLRMLVGPLIDKLCLALPGGASFSLREASASQFIYALPLGPENRKSDRAGRKALNARRSAY